MIRKKFGFKKDKNIAQGMVEFALTIPIFLLLAFGLIEFSRLLFVYISVTTSSREAVRYGSAVGDNGSGTPRYLDCDGIKDAAKVFGQLSTILDDEILINYDTDGDDIYGFSCSTISEDDVDWGDRIEVIVTNTFTFGGIIPFIDFPPFPITSVARRTIMKGAVVVEEPDASAPTPIPENQNLKPFYGDSSPEDTNGNKCYDIKFTWSPNGLWDEAVTFYYLREIGGNTVEVPPDMEEVSPGVWAVVFFSDFDILNNDTGTFRLYANFVSGSSKTLTFTLHCQDGVLTKVGG